MPAILKGALLVGVLFVGSVLLAHVPMRHNSAERGARALDESNPSCMDECAAEMVMCAQDPECAPAITCVHDKCTDQSDIQCQGDCFSEIPDNANAQTILECGAQHCPRPDEQEVEEKEEKAPDTDNAEDKEEPNDGPNSAKFETIVQVGKMAWTIIKANKPVFNTKLDHASALPEGVNDVTKWTDLEEWQNAAWDEDEPFEYQVRNLYGHTVAQIQFVFSWNAFGSYNHIGSYIGQATIEPGHQSVAWGWSMTVTGSAAEPYNAGTKEHPKAALKMTMDMKVTSILTTVEYTCTVIVRGDGSAKEVNCPQYDYSR